MDMFSMVFMDCRRKISDVVVVWFVKWLDKIVRRLWDIDGFFKFISVWCVKNVD